MKSTLGAAGIAAVGVFAAATATASPIVQGLGSSETLVDGALITDYTVSNLQPANVTIAGYTPKGQLWQAEVNARANSGVVTPVVSNFNARTSDNVTYRVISTKPTPEALSPAPITQGGQTNGKVYFDVTGAPPTNVVYNDGVQDVLVWTTNAPNSVPGQAPNAVPGESPNPAPGQAPGQSPSPTPNAPAHS
jgi:opacity protein-like surface antigen